MASPPAAATAAGGQPLTPSDVADGVAKCGYLRKQTHGHRRFFVLRERGERRPARLEYYDSEKKWRGRGAARRVVPLDACLCVSKRADAKHKHLVALYTRDEYFAVAADSARDQDAWFRALSDLVAAGRPAGPAATSSLVGFEEDADYVPASAYREVWQVHVKAKGLGQTRNLSGVYRLCLSGRAVGFVKVNADAAAVSLQLMNIRRCGHADSFFFMEVGRSAATGPGELWMQAEDPVVAQNIHETVLDAMRAMRELAEFRPRSKSQSAGSNPISVPGARRHPPLARLTASRAGLGARRSAFAGTDGDGTRRVRTASEGDGGSGTLGSSPGGQGHLIRSHTLSGGRTCRMLESELQHSRSVPAAGPGPGEEYWGCGPGDARYLLPLARSVTPDSPCGTPPSRDADAAYRMRTCSLTAPRRRGGAAAPPPPPPSSTSLDDYTMMRMAARRAASPTRGSSSSPRWSSSPRGGSYPEDYGLVAIGGSSPATPRSLEDGGYMPMRPGGGGAASGAAAEDDYVPTSPMCVSAPQLILNPGAPRAHRTGSPVSPEDSGYMRMWGASRSPDGRGGGGGEYMNMSPGNPPPLQTPPDYYLGPLPGPGPGPVRTAYRASAQASRTQESDDHQDDGGGPYVLMSPQGQRPRGGEDDYYAMMQSPSAQTQTQAQTQAQTQTQAQVQTQVPAYRGRPGRPNRLALDTVRTLPSMKEHPAPGEPPRSPGEYINIDFGGGGRSPPSLASAGSGPSSPGSGGGGVRRRSPLSDYMNLRPGSRSPQEAEEAGPARLDRLPEASLCAAYRPDDPGDYTEMTFDPSGSPPLQPVRPAASGFPGGGGGGERSLSTEDRRIPGFPPDAPAASDPDRAAKVIRADPRGRRRHSSETFSSTATVTPVPPSFAAAAADALKRHSSAENVSSRSSEGSDEECGSPPGRAAAAASGGGGGGGGFRRGGLDSYMALNLLEKKKKAGGDAHKDLGGFKPANSCKGGVGGLHAAPYVCLGFKEAATTAQD